METEWKSVNSPGASGKSCGSGMRFSMSRCGFFRRKGYHNVSMHEIAKEAEFAIGTLYKFFRNKEDLYQALMLQLSDRFHGALKAVVEGER